MIRILLAVVVVGVAGCATTPPIVAVVPGMTPLPLAMRADFTVYDREEMIRRCVPAMPILRPDAARKMCACSLDTMPVYMTQPQVAAENAKFADHPDAPGRMESPVIRVMLACRRLVTGE